MNRTFKHKISIDISNKNQLRRLLDSCDVVENLDINEKHNKQIIQYIEYLHLFINNLETTNILKENKIK